MGHTQVVARGITLWLSAVEPYLTKATSIKLVQGQQDVAWRTLQCATLKRQHEALCATLKMVEEGIGHFAVTLVRPAFEELLWIEYLSKYQNHAEELCKLMARKEIADALHVQNEYLGAKQMQEMGFTQKFVKSSLAFGREVEASLRLTGRTLGWGREGTVVPSVATVARSVRRERDYKYIYQATSRFVHFSPQELYRRVWGINNEAEISSKALAPYWTSFALYWQFWTFVHLLNALIVLLGDFGLVLEGTDSLLQDLEALRTVPIITAEELKPWRNKAV